MEFISKGTPEARHRLIILTDMENEPDDAHDHGETSDVCQ